MDVQRIPVMNSPPSPNNNNNNNNNNNITMDNPKWLDNGLVSIITVFQQHKLRPELTSVKFGTAAFSKAFHEELLRHDSIS